MAKKKRNRTKQAKTLVERLTDEANRLLDDAKALPAGEKRAALLSKAQQLEDAAGIADWLSIRKKWPDDGLNSYV